MMSDEQGLEARIQNKQQTQVGTGEQSQKLINYREITQRHLNILTSCNIYVVLLEYNF